MNQLKKDIVSLEQQKTNLLAEIAELERKKTLVRSLFQSDVKNVQYFGFRNDRHLHEMEKQLQEAEEKAKKETQSAFAIKKVVNTLIDSYEVCLVGILNVGKSMMDAHPDYRKKDVEQELVGVARALKMFRALCRPLGRGEEAPGHDPRSYMDTLGLGL
jgi:hypothetical protein